MLRFAVLCLFGLTTITARFLNTESPPEWSPRYTVKGIFYRPLDDVQEPFEAWYDFVKGTERMDYHGSNTSVVIRLPTESQPRGLMRKVFHYTSEMELNELKCVDHSLSGQEHHTDSVLPNMSRYKFIETETIYGNEVSKWQLVKMTHDGSIREERTMWIAGVGDAPTPLPLRFEINEYNTARGIHSNQFRFDFTDYRTVDIDDSIFEIDQDMQCDQEDDQLLLNPIHFYLHLENSAPVEHHFERFKQKHGRQYSDEEHRERLDIFRENLRFIKEHNRKKDSYKMAVNHFADRTAGELAGLFGGRKTPSHMKGLPFPDNMTLQALRDDLPDEYDWRNHGAITPVKAQLSCGSCWAFASVGVVESALFINRKSEHLLRLSEQALVDCSWGTGGYLTGNSGCGGGNAGDAFEWIRRHGLPTYEAYGGYLAENGMCHVENVTSVAFIKDWYKVRPRDENALKMAIFKNGPVAVSFFANTRSFMFYSSGVYSDEYYDCPAGESDHLVLAVGYGELNGERYLLVKNSWGHQWGLNGYFLIATKSNTCGIMDEPSFVVV